MVICFRTTSLDSLFVSLKFGRCPYFYVCTHSMTMLFTCRATLLDLSAQSPGLEEQPQTPLTAAATSSSRQTRNSASNGSGRSQHRKANCVDGDPISAEKTASPRGTTIDGSLVSPSTPHLPRTRPSNSSSNTTHRPATIALTPSAYATSGSKRGVTNVGEGLASTPSHQSAPNSPLTSETPPSTPLQEVLEASLVVMMTPTTRGFRDHLTAQGLIIIIISLHMLCNIFKILT